MSSGRSRSGGTRTSTMLRRPRKAERLLAQYVSPNDGPHSRRGTSRRGVLANLARLHRHLEVAVCGGDDAGPRRPLARPFED